jgi:hypothetical protein
MDSFFCFTKESKCRWHGWKVLSCHAIIVWPVFLQTRASTQAYIGHEPHVVSEHATDVSNFQRCYLSRTSPTLFSISFWSLAARNQSIERVTDVASWFAAPVRFELDWAAIPFSNPFFSAVTNTLKKVTYTVYSCFFFSTTVKPSNFVSHVNFGLFQIDLLTTPRSHIIGHAPNIGPLISCWELDKFKIAQTKALEPLESWHFCISNFRTC